MPNDKRGSFEKERNTYMMFLAKTLLDLGIVVVALKIDSSGYGAALATIVLLRYELGPMFGKD
jgi:hypothetical protein